MIGWWCSSGVVVVDGGCVLCIGLIAGKRNCKLTLLRE